MYFYLIGYVVQLLIGVYFIALHLLKMYFVTNRYLSLFFEEFIND